MRNQQTIENQIGIRIVDSGIGNPNRVRDKNIEDQKYDLTIVRYVTSG